MTPPQAPAVNERAIFADALDIADPAGRASFLDQACAGDADLRQRLDSLIGEVDHLGTFLDYPALVRNGVVAPPVAERPGDMVGPYKLLEKIGEGGMGAVYMAEQTSPVRRRVALKIVKPGLDTEQVVARFEAERQALALMDHPNIAKVFDGGTTGEPGGLSPRSGRPYFVMELVRGLPITEYCDQARLSVRDRLALFVQVCQAVQHAHQKGVIHRDLKPSNVLVTVIDGRPVPKVIDFGVAKATEQKLTDRTLFTGFHQLLGTPLYMSPEQAELSGVDVDTRTDVYALGVLLYELLTGTTPFDATVLRTAAFDEVRRIIREEEPARPSRRLSTLAAEQQTTVSERRGVDGRRLGRLLRGELDWVVMRALEKDRNRRYESAGALAADVGRYLADEPVSAGPPSARYWARKYARRHRRSLATAGVIAAALVAATAVSTWQAVKASEARREAATEAAIAKAVNEFLQRDLLGQAASAPLSDREPDGDPYLTVKEALDRAAARIGDRFQDQPLVEAAIRTAIGQAYMNLSMYPPAAPHLERAVALRREHLGPDRPDTLASLWSLAETYHWLGRNADNFTLCQQILESRQAALGPDHLETLAAKGRVANASIWIGRWNIGIPLLKEVLARQRAVLGPTHPDTIGAMHDLAMTYTDLGRFDESIPLHEEVLKSLRATIGPENTAESWETLTCAQAYQRAGKLDEADRMIRDVLEHRPGRQGFRSLVARANALRWLALNRLLQGRYAAVEQPAREAITLFEKYRPEDPWRFYLISVLGNALHAQGKHAEAEPLLLQGYEGLKKREAAVPEGQKYRLAEVGERVVRFYEETGQPGKAREWQRTISQHAVQALTADGPH